MENKQVVSVDTAGKGGVIMSRERQPGESKSSWFRRLYDDYGMGVAEIARYTKSHYSFVYGVIDRHTDGEIRKEEGPSKSDLIREMAAKGMTAGAIAKALNSNYSFVHGVVKRYREERQKVFQQLVEAAQRPEEDQELGKLGDEELGDEEDKQDEEEG